MDDYTFMGLNRQWESRIEADRTPECMADTDDELLGELEIRLRDGLLDDSLVFRHRVRALHFGLIEDINAKLEKHLSDLESELR